MGDPLITEFKRIKARHKRAICIRAARVVLGSSVIRVFNSDSKDRLLRILKGVNVSGLLNITSEKKFKNWFELELDRLGTAIEETNKDNNRIYPGYKWGHATKVLTLYVREVVLNSRYFTEEEVSKISPLLFVPIDSVAIRRLRKLGIKLSFSAIKDIDTPDKFYNVQRLLGEAALEVGVPRIWFDDNWGDRQ
jgi:hypothetical protein